MSKSAFSERFLSLVEGADGLPGAVALLATSGASMVRGKARVIGRRDFDLEGTSGNRAIQPYSQWMFQRPVSFFQQLDAAGRTSVEPLLQVGGLTALTTSITTRLEFVKHRVRRVDPVPAAVGSCGA